jgi:DNA repair exonuclease SbcCD nuclease subunit
MSIITDLGIRKDLVEHYDRYKEAHEIDQVTARYWETIQIPFLLDRVDMRTKKFVGPTDYRSHQFKNILMGHIALLQQKTEIYRKSLNGVDSLRSRLSAFAEGF